MPVNIRIEENSKVILLEGVVSPEEVDELYELIRDNPEADADLSACEHLHTAALQLLLMAKIKVSVLPESLFWQQFFVNKGEPVT